MNLDFISDIMKNVKDNAAAAHASLLTTRVKGSAGGGLVEVEVNGLSEMTSCKIDKSLLSGQDTELLEELIVVAVNDAIQESKDIHTEKMQEMTGGIELPKDLGDIFGKG
ncbi:MAG: YbaB/EbfC family nucleoid-associated protein [Planctomycetaceae bacterium]|jgi:DNA-binding YbaB/EbfC family protein|nr:YbaB/EbfC family nucleoid-associated protein [Planctomycetaceae bacterium]